MALAAPTSRPQFPATGTVYYDTEQNVLYGYDGYGWSEVGKERPPQLKILCYTTRMSTGIRVAIEIDQEAEDGTPIAAKVLDLDGNEATVYTGLYEDDPAEQPISMIAGEGILYVEDGGEYDAHFTWKASDGKDRGFTQRLKIPLPPTCPKCERRVPELTDYVCEECRFG
jgi:hypothetical protein